MRQKARWAAVLLQLVPALVAGQSPGLERLLPAQPDGYVTDRATIVDAESRARIEELAARLRSAAGAELAVVTLPSIGNYAPEEVARALGRSWGVGARADIGDPRRNAGAVLLLVPRTADQRGQVFLSTGRGLEGIVTDATAGRITDLMLPELREGRYGPALVTGTEAFVAIVARGMGVTDSALTAASPDAGAGDGGEIPLGPGVVVLLFFMLLLLMLLAARFGSRLGARSGGGTWPGGWGGGGFGGGWGGGGGGFGGFGGGGGFSGGGSGRSF